MTVSAQTTFNNYTGNGVTTVFPYQFKILDQGDLDVYVGGVLKTIGVDYTVSGVGADVGGAVTFISAPSSVAVSIVRSMAVQRTTDYQQQGDFNAGTVNPDFDRAILLIQDVNTQLGRSIRTPADEVGSLPTLPSITNRAGMYMGFDANGLPVASAGTGNDTALRTDLANGAAGPGSDLVAIKRTAAEIAAGVTPVSYFYPPGYISRYGTNTTPGTTDMSVAFTNMVNANKGGRCYVDSVCLIAGIILNGSSYDGTEIYTIGAGELKLKADGGASNFDTTIWAGIVVLSCDRVRLDVRFDGNRTAMTSREGIHCIILAAATFPYVRAKIREQRGDGVYIDRASPLNSGAGASTTDFTVFVDAYNSADDGRNAVSIISGQRGVVGVNSYRVGGIVNALQMPGGLDLEPNWPAQSITDITIAYCNVTTAGTGGLQIAGRAATNDATRDWNIQRIVINSANIVHTDTNGKFLLRRAFDVSGRVACSHQGVRGVGAFIDLADRIPDLTISTKFTTFGVMLGYNDIVNDANLTLMVNDYGSGGTAGVLVANIQRCTINGNVYGALAAASALGVELTRNGRGAFSQVGVVYSLNFPYDANVAIVYFNGAATDQVGIGQGTCLLNSNMLGFGLATQTNANLQIPSYNCPGRNVGNGLTAAPAAGTWAQFDEVSLDQAAGSTVPRVKCITGGNPGTWKNYGNLSA